MLEISIIYNAVLGQISVFNVKHFIQNKITKSLFLYELLKNLDRALIFVINRNDSVWIYGLYVSVRIYELYLFSEWARSPPSCPTGSCCLASPTLTQGSARSSYSRAQTSGSSPRLLKDIWGRVQIYRPYSKALKWMFWGNTHTLLWIDL